MTGSLYSSAELCERRRLWRPFFSRFDLLVADDPNNGHDHHHWDRSHLVRLRERIFAGTMIRSDFNGCCQPLPFIAMIRFALLISYLTVAASLSFSGLMHGTIGLTLVAVAVRSMANAARVQSAARIYNCTSTAM